MNNILYQSVIVPCNKSEDGDTPTVVYVTQETNCCAVWLSSYQSGTELLKWFRGSNEAIEFGVCHASTLKQQDGNALSAFCLNPNAKS